MDASKVHVRSGHGGERLSVFPAAYAIFDDFRVDPCFFIYEGSTPWFLGTVVFTLSRVFHPVVVSSSVRMRERMRVREIN